MEFLVKEEWVAVLDEITCSDEGMQYFSSGPCEAGAEDERTRTFYSVSCRKVLHGLGAHTDRESSFKRGLQSGKDIHFNG